MTDYGIISGKEKEVEFKIDKKQQIRNNSDSQNKSIERISYKHNTINNTLKSLSNGRGDSGSSKHEDDQKDLKLRQKKKMLMSDSLNMLTKQRN